MIIYLLGILGIICAALYFLSPILLPFIVGLIAAYLMDPLAKKIVKLGLSRNLAALLPPVLFIALFLAVAFIAFPLITEDILAFAKKSPDYLSQAKQSLTPFIEKQLGAYIHMDRADVLQKISIYAQEIATTSLKAANWMIASTSALINLVSLLFITPVIMFYLIRDWPKIIAAIEKIVPPKYRKELKKLLGGIDTALAGFLRGQLNVALAQGMIYGAGLWLIGLEMGLFIGFVTGLFSFIPYVGMLLGALAAFGVAVVQFQFDSWTPYLFIASVFAFGQLVESFFLTPKFVGDKTGLHPAWVIFALMAGSQLAGFTGILIALPVATILTVVVPYGLSRWQQSPLYKKKS